MKPYFSTRTIHTLTYYDISAISEGSGFFTVGEQTHIVKPRNVVFTRPEEARNWDNRGIRDGLSLVFEEQFILDLFNDPGFLRQLPFFSMGRYSCCVYLDESTFARLEGLLYRLQEALEAPGDLPRMRSLLYEALMLLYRSYLTEHTVLPILPEEEKRVKSGYVNDFLNLVDTHYTQQHAIRFYASRLKITPNYLNEILKKSLGMNAKLYIQNRITQEAKRLLIYTELSVSAIAGQLSFETPSYFIRFFRNQTGHTPLQFRNLTR
jgi:AraC-like DNA-binding protein